MEQKCSDCSKVLILSGFPAVLFCYREVYCKEKKNQKSLNKESKTVVRSAD